MIVAVIQARMGSTRLPGKVLERIGRRTLLDEVIARAEASRAADQVIVATTTSPKDDAVAAHCEAVGQPFTRGSEEDVLDRMYQAALSRNASHVIRLTADNPLFDTKTLFDMTLTHVQAAADYTHCVTAWGCQLPYGAGAEIFTMASLAASWAEGRAPEHREHVDEFVYQHPERFHIRLVQPEPSLRRPELLFTVDRPDHLANMRALFSALENGDGVVSLGDAIAYLDRHPDLLQHFQMPHE